MNSYRPVYIGHPYHTYAPPPPPHPPSGAMPPLPLGPPPPYDPYRGGDSWRPNPPQSDFSFHRNDVAPQWPHEQDYSRSTQSGRPRQENRRPQYNDNINLNRVRRGQKEPYIKPRQNHRTAPADRPLLRHHDEGGEHQQMLGMMNGQKFMAMGDISDSDDEQMDVSDLDKSDGDVVKTNPDVHDEIDLPGQDELERPSKRRALTTQAPNGSNEPKWSNPDPYTVLPPVDEASRKRKDVVKLIRKARKEAEDTAANHNQVAANDDFISFGMDEEQAVDPMSTSVQKNEEDGRGVPGAPVGPRNFSHLHNLHGQGQLEGPAQSLPDEVQIPPSVRVLNGPIVPENIVLDLGQRAVQDVRHGTYDQGGDETLGSRKRTHDDTIKGGKKGPPHVNGSILREWRPAPGADATPWLRRTDLITANAGFRLHKEICDFYDFVKPQYFEQTVRQELLSRLEKTINGHLPNSMVHCFGSFAAGLYLPNADMDVVVVSDSFSSSGRKVACQTHGQMYKFARYLESSGLTTKKCDVIVGAKVPIIKFVDSLTGIRVDVSFENDTGIVANATFATWKAQYPAMPVLVTIIKQFLMMRGLNEVQHGGLGGFSVTCLVTSLLQNMPRVQAGEVVPEQHLGEMLLEFLDFYGNQLDTRRTGIVMEPHGYFQKDIYSHHRAGRRGPTYQANKADRLAIIDPNKPDNDISGGSRDVMSIFDRFALAHKEILQAMKSPGRISLLDWSLGGNYESFASQREHLLKLYQEKWESPIGITARRIFPEKQSAGDEVLGSIRGGGSVAPESAVAIVFDAAIQAEAQDPPSNVLDEPHEPMKPSKKELKHLASKRKSMKRAADLKIAYPKMQGIPPSLSQKAKKKLLANYGEKGKPLKAPAKAPVTKPVEPTKGQVRARKLRKDYPNMPNVPKQVGSKRCKTLIAMYKEQQASEAGNQANQKLVLPQQPPGPVSGSTQELTTRLRPRPSRSAPDRQGRPVSNKMAPLSDARRAEVARNLGGTSNDNPITLD